jgi:hypothetical protein
MEGKKTDEKPMVCFLQPDFIQTVKAQESPCFDVTVLDDATVFHVRIRQCTENGHDSHEDDASNSTKVSVKVLGESLGDEGKIKAAKSESFGEGGAGKRELLLIIGEVLNQKKEKEDGIKVGMISSRDVNM